MAASGANNDNHKNYDEFDLLDEQVIVSMQKMTMDSRAALRYESIALVGESQWYVLFMLIWVNLIPVYASNRSSCVKWRFMRLMTIYASNLDLCVQDINIAIFGKIN